MEKIQNIPSLVHDLIRIIKNANFSSLHFIKTWKKVLNGVKKDFQKQIYFLTTSLHFISALQLDHFLSHDDAQLINPNFIKLFENTLVNIRSEFGGIPSENEKKDELKNLCLVLMNALNEIGRGTILSKVIASLLECFVSTFTGSNIDFVCVYFGIKKISFK